MSKSLLEEVEQLTPTRRARWFKKLSTDAQKSIALGLAWWFIGRPEQFAPSGFWRWWLISAGRGFGKTRSGAEWSAAKARKYPGARIALVAVSYADGRDTMVEGDSGLLSVLHPSELRGGTIEAAWNRSLGELFLANGSRFKIYSSERPRQLRGPQHHFVWGDEPAYWNDADKGTGKDSTFSNVNIGLRLRPPRNGLWDREYRPQGVLTTTPRRVPLLKVPDEMAKLEPSTAGLYQRPDVVITLGSTMDNIDNLADDYRAAVVDPMIGTTLGRQELGGEMLEDVEGALWIQAVIDATRVIAEAMPQLSKTAVAFDPSGGAGIGHDEMGIVVGGVTGTRLDMHMYVTKDLSQNCTPTEAAKIAIKAYYAYGCSAIVYEKNQGQDWIPTTFEATWKDMITSGEIPDDIYHQMPTMEPVTAVKDKYQRARPVAGLYEQKRVHHVGVLGTLEGQQTTWVPDDGLPSPDRLDALVWLITWLYGMGPNRADVASAAKRENRRGGRRADMPSSRLPAVYDGRRSGRR